MAAIEQYGGGQNANSLPLFYVHAANENKGDGSVENPFGNFDLLCDFFDANPTLVGGTVIVLGGTFTVTRNIYRANSFYFFSGTKIICNGVTLLKDDGSYTLHEGDFFFNGEVEIEINNVYNSETEDYDIGHLFDCGYYYSKSGNRGRKWTIDVAKVTKNGIGDLIYCYGSINTNRINIRELLNYGSNVITAIADQRPSLSGSVLANSGCILDFSSDSYYGHNGYGALLATGGGAYDFFTRTTIVKVKKFELLNGPSSNAVLFKGNLNLSRPAQFHFYIGLFSANLEYGGFFKLFEITGYYTDGIRTTYFIFHETTFTYNTIVGSSGQVFLPPATSDVNVKAIFKQCLMPSTCYKTYPYGEVSTNENCNDVTGTILTVFNDKNNSLCHSIINN